MPRSQQGFPSLNFPSERDRNSWQAGVEAIGLGNKTVTMGVFIRTLANALILRLSGRTTVLSRKQDIRERDFCGNFCCTWISIKALGPADALRSNTDAAEYKHVVLGLNFLKYISDAFESKHAELERQRTEGADPENPDEYRGAHIFWVPKEARWQHLKASAPQPKIGTIVDDAMAAIERENPSLKGVLPKDYARPGLDKQRLGQLINLISNVGLSAPADRAKDVLGRVYEYFLSQFASAEGQKGRPVLHARACRPRSGGDARALQGPRLRSLLRLWWHVRAERKIHRGAQRQNRRCPQDIYTYCDKGDRRLLLADGWTGCDRLCPRDRGTRRAGAS
jgi:hypothetical protein